MEGGCFLKAGSSKLLLEREKKVRRMRATAVAAGDSLMWSSVCTISQQHRELEILLEEKGLEPSFCSFVLPSNFSM